MIQYLPARDPLRLNTFVRARSHACMCAVTVLCLYDLVQGYWISAARRIGYYRLTMSSIIATLIVLLSHAWSRQQVTWSRLQQGTVGAASEIHPSSLTDWLFIWGYYQRYSIWSNVNVANINSEGQRLILERVRHPYRFVPPCLPHLHHLPIPQC